jgi:hypothetical protein
MARALDKVVEMQMCDHQITLLLGAGAQEARAALARLAATLMQLLLAHSRFGPMVRSAAAPPLPKLAAELQAPLASLLPVVDADVAPEQARAPFSFLLMAATNAYWCSLPNMVLGTASIYG